MCTRQDPASRVDAYPCAGFFLGEDEGCCEGASSLWALIVGCFERGADGVSEPLLFFFCRVCSSAWLRPGRDLSKVISGGVVESIKLRGGMMSLFGSCLSSVVGSGVDFAVDRSWRDILLLSAQNLHLGL